MKRVNYKTVGISFINSNHIFVSLEMTNVHQHQGAPLNICTDFFSFGYNVEP